MSWWPRPTSSGKLDFGAHLDQVIWIGGERFVTSLTLVLFIFFNYILLQLIINCP